jgi:hypothetical protein
MRLFHFSEQADIAVFEPRLLKVPAPRPEGQEWLNGPLVWAISEAQEALYLFPRDCPRILAWRTHKTSPEDVATWLGTATRASFVAFVEHGSLRSLSAVTLYRYELPAASFELVDRAGMWVSRERVVPLSVDRIGDLPEALAARNVELRAVADLSLLRPLWSSSMAASGIRLRNSGTWARSEEHM